VCNSSSGSPSCTTCPANGTTTFYADSINGSDGAGGVTPTGVLSPPLCRFGTLTQALAAAGAAAIASAGPADVVATGASPGTPMTFTTQAAGNSETFPLVVPDDVTLESEASLGQPGTYTILFPPGGASVISTAIALGSAGTGPVTFSGFTVSFAATAPTTASAVTIVSPSTLSQLLLQGNAGNTASGVLDNGVSPANLNTVTVQGFGTGCSVTHASASPAETWSGVTLTGNTVGLDLSRGLLYADGLVVQNSIDEGILSSAAAVSLTLDGGEVMGNGLTTDGGGSPGILWNNGTLSMAGTQITGSGSDGLRLRAGSVGSNSTPALNVTLSNNGVSTGTGTGLNMTGGSVIADFLTADSNLGVGLALNGTAVLSSPTVDSNGLIGVTVAGGATSITIQNPTFNLNGGQGMTIANGVVAITGTGTITGNGATLGVAGIYGSGGTLTIGSAASAGVITLQGNTNFGINFDGLGGSVDNALITGNGNSGVRINSSSPVTLTSCTIQSNGALGIKGHGVQIESAPPGGGLTTATANVLGCTIDSNAEDGVRIVGSGNVTAAIRTSTIDSNAEYGVRVQEAAGNTSKFTIAGCDISKNLAGGIRVEGGTALNGASIRASSIHGNTGDQVELQVADTNPWNLANGGCSNDSNEIYCYDGGAGAYGINAAAGVPVLASNIYWQVPLPVLGTDYSDGGVAIGFYTDAGLEACPPKPTNTCP
jgi:hypothetical protein